MSLLNEIIQFTTVLSPSPAGRVSFGSPLLITPLATNSLNGDTVRQYGGISAVQSDLDAGYIEQATFDRLQVMFSQPQRPNIIKVGAADLAGGSPETYGEALTRIQGSDTAFYPVLLASRTAADIVSLAAAIEASETKHQLFGQVSDADWLTAGAPAAYSTITSNLRTSLVYHDTNTVFADCGWVSNRIGFSPDDRSVDWKCDIIGVSPYATPLSTPQRTALGFGGNSVNAVEPFGSQNNWLYDGYSISARPVSTVFTADWYSQRVQEDIADLFARAAAFGDKIVVDEDGQEQFVSIFEKRFAQGVRTKHFIADQYRITAEPITQTDLDASQVRFTLEAQEARGARRVLINFFLQNAPLAEV